MDYHVPEDQGTVYARSKSGNLLHAAEFQRRYQDSGIVSVSMNPGLLKTNLQRNFSATQKVLVSITGRPAQYGAYTELFAGLDASVTAEDKCITPFGKKEKPRADLVEPELGKKYWAWSEAQVEKYL